MKKLVLLMMAFVALVPAAGAASEWQWHNPQRERANGASNIWNQGWDEENYTRLPKSAEPEVRKSIWNLSRHSAGLMLKFVTDADVIKVRYGVTGGWNMHHMPTTGVSGIDLYRLNPDGTDSFCAGNYSFKDTVTYTFDVNRKLIPGDQEYALYLPTYNSVKWLEVGVKDGETFRFVPAPSQERPIVIYGSSITQGACSSRPGMAWTNIVNRRLRHPVVNFGFSGNGRLEPEVIKYIIDLNPAVFVLDCLPNLDREKPETVEKLVIDAVKQIRDSSDAPILLVEHAGYSSDGTDNVRHESHNSLNATQHAAYKKLCKEGVKNLHYLSQKEIGMDPDSWVDVVHYTDVGMQNLGKVASRRLKKILR